MIRRWLKFNTVGAIGVGVQLAVLAILKSLLHIEYLLSTALAVEAAVLHNFIWHERWTWAERRGARTSGLRSGRACRVDTRVDTKGRLLRFHLTNGLVSIVSNLLCMRLLVGRYHLQYLIANVLSIAVTSLLNFFLSELFVFRK